MMSLRARFASAFVVGQLALLAIGTVVAYRTGVQTITRQFDEALTAQVTNLASLLEQEGRHVGIEIDEVFMQEYIRDEDPEYFELFFGDYVLGRSPALGKDDLDLRFGTLEEPAIWDDELPDGRAGRCIGVELTVSEVDPDPETGAVADAATVTLVLAKSRADLDRLSSLLLYGLLVGAALLMLCGILVTWGAVTLSLRPVRTLARRVEAVDVHTLAVPLEAPAVPRELLPIVTGLNDLLQRLDVALRAERRAASNMAHELMTPISELRTLTEIALKGHSEPAYRERVLELAHDISLQMGNLIRMVRQLTHIDAATGVLPGEQVPVAAFVEAALARVRERADAKHLQLDVQVNGEVMDCNRDALLSVCNNLLGNAVEYTPEGGRLELRSFSEQERITLRISNDCDDLGDEHLPHLTEPFWRLSASRSDTHHHGLGLTIAQGMAALAGIELNLRVESGRFVAEATTGSYRV